MTTVIFNQNYLVADSQRTSGNIKLPHIFHKIYFTKKVVLAYCGMVSNCQYIINNKLWDIRKQTVVDKLNEVLDDKSSDEIIIELLLIDKSNIKKGYYFNNGAAAAIPTINNFVMGSGRSIAMGALAQGATAIEALQITAKLDLYTDANIQWYNLEDNTHYLPKIY